MTTQISTLTPGADRQKVAEAGSARQFTPIGLDCGNGAVKLYSAMGETLLESYVAYQSERPTYAGNGYAEYISGDRPDLSGKLWIGGINAYNSARSAITRTVDSKDGKVSLCLQLLISALSHYPHRAEWDLMIACSIHDGQVFGKAVRQALQGTHRVRMRGKESLVNIVVSHVVEEGTGAAVAVQQKFDLSSALVIDLGHGTAIASTFNGLHLALREYDSSSGAESLIHAIANSDYVRRALLAPGDKHLIRAGIEKGDFSYGTQRPDWNFKEAYASEFPAWFNRGLSGFVKLFESQVPAASSLIAIGGGAMLPGMVSALAKKGFATPEQPRWVNSKGLYQLALRASSKTEAGLCA
jgi:Actin like proteins N terminal domain